MRIRGFKFAYVEDHTLALDSLELDLPPGRRIARVGPSGAGKTTLANLLLRFRDFHQGVIELDGVDIRLYDPQDVRKMLAVLSQPAFLFRATLRQNLLIAQPGALTVDLEEAVSGAYLDELVARLPQGLDT